jgi:hypothetical protein
MIYLILGLIGIVCAVICLICETETSKRSASICLILATILIICGGNNLLK